MNIAQTIESFLSGEPSASDIRWWNIFWHDVELKQIPKDQHAARNPDANEMVLWNKDCSKQLPYSFDDHRKTNPDYSEKKVWNGSRSWNDVANKYSFHDLGISC